MKRLARFLIRLYPANWRQRYGEEFSALLEDSPPTPVTLFDLLKGALKMQLSLPTLPKLALLLSTAGLLAGFCVSYLVTPRYVSAATLQFLGPGANGIAAHLREEVLSRTNLSSIIQDPPLNQNLSSQLYQEERNRLPTEDVIKIMHRDLSIDITPPGDNLVISFVYRDPYLAYATVNALVRSFQTLNRNRQRAAANFKPLIPSDRVGRLEARVAVLEKRLGIAPSESSLASKPVPSWLDPTSLDVLDPPSLPAHPIYPDRQRFMIDGLGIGFVLALVIAIFRHRSQPALPFPAATA